MRARVLVGLVYVVACSWQMDLLYLRHGAAWQIKTCTAEVAQALTAAMEGREVCVETVEPTLW